MITSTAGVTLYVTGATTRPLAIPATGSFGLAGFNGKAPANARLAALQTLLGLDRGNTFVAAAVGHHAAGDRAVGDGESDPGQRRTRPPPRAFAGQNSSIAQQLLAVAKMIEARAATGSRRQIFFVSLGGFDTHNNELATQQNLLGQLSPALKAFHDATGALGVAQQVTTFTLSDFGRTFQPAAGGGSDHAWGNHHLILGGAVRGGSLYGTIPDPRAGRARRRRARGPLDSDHRRRPVRGDARAVVRRQSGATGDGVSQSRPLSDERSRLHGLRRAVVGACRHGDGTARSTDCGGHRRAFG